MTRPGLFAAWRRWAAGLLVTLAVIGVGGSAGAQTSRDLWVPLVDEFAALDRADLEQVFVEVLGSPSGPAHIVGLAGISAVVSGQGFSLPSCFEGRSVCASDVAAAARALQADRVITASAREGGRALHLTLFDVELGQRSEIEIRGTDTRDAVFQAVASVTDASAMLIVTSTPDGAALYLDNQLVGTTPYEGTLAIGAYDIRLEVEGYVAYVDELELRAGDVREAEVELERLYAEVTIQSAAPGAEIVVDGDATYRAGEPFRVDPGDHELLIRAPGYDSDTRTLNLLAGETRSYRVTLSESMETISARKYDQIRSRPFTLQLGFVGAGFRTNWNNARVRLDGDRERLSCPAAPAGRGGCGDNTQVGLLGAGLDVLYDYKWFQMQLFGYRMTRINLRGDDNVYVVRDRSDRVSGRAGREIHFRLPSFGLRWQVNSDWSAAIRTGPAVSFQRVEGTVQTNGSDRRFRRTDWLLETDLLGRYHVTNGFFAFAELDLGIVLDHANTRARIGGTLGIGLNLRDPTGMVRASTMNGGSNPPPPSPEPSGAPTEL